MINRVMVANRPLSRESEPTRLRRVVITGRQTIQVPLCNTQARCAGAAVPPSLSPLESSPDRPAQYRVSGQPVRAGNGLDMRCLLLIRRFGSCLLASGRDKAIDPQQDRPQGDGNKEPGDGAAYEY